MCSLSGGIPTDSCFCLTTRSVAACQHANHQSVTQTCQLVISSASQSEPQVASTSQSEPWVTTPTAKIKSYHVKQSELNDWVKPLEWNVTKPTNCVSSSQQIKTMYHQSFNKSKPCIIRSVNKSKPCIIRSVNKSKLCIIKSVNKSKPCIIKSVNKSKPYIIKSINKSKPCIIKSINKSKPCIIKPINKNHITPQPMDIMLHHISQSNAWYRVKPIKTCYYFKLITISATISTKSKSVTASNQSKSGTTWNQPKFVISPNQFKCYYTKPIKICYFS